MVSCCLSQASTFPTRPPSAWEVSLKLSAEHVAILQGFPAGFGVGLSLQCDSGEHVTPDPRLPLCRSVVLNALHELGRLPEVSLQGENWLHALNLLFRSSTLLGSWCLLAVQCPSSVPRTPAWFCCKACWHPHFPPGRRRSEAGTTLYTSLHPLPVLCCSAHSSCSIKVCGRNDQGDEGKMHDSGLFVCFP